MLLCALTSAGVTNYIVEKQAAKHGWCDRKIVIGGLCELPFNAQKLILRSCSLRSCGSLLNFAHGGPTNC
jgi:hypothetical protein